MTDSRRAAARTDREALDEAVGQLVGRDGAPTERRRQTVRLVPTPAPDAREADGRRHGVGRPFVDRRVECAELDGLLWAVRAGESRALVVVGESGVGKTALLDHLVAQASGCRVLRASGVESEMELAFGGLHQVCTPLLDRAERLPDPQRDALRTALGLAAGPEPDRFLVGLAVLGLLADAATEWPLVCVIDDAQWLDRASAQALAFTARRLVAESVALVFAANDAEQVPELAGLARLRVSGLPEAEARVLLDSVLPGHVDERVLDRIVAEARGNPLALLELPRGLTAPELAGSGDLPGASGAPGRVEESFRRQLAAMPGETRRLLLVAAAEPLGDPVLLWRAAGRLGIADEAAAPAAEAGLMRIDSRVRFRHPLLRSAVYRAAPAEARRAAHQALAEEIDPQADPEHHAWHAAQAATAPNEQVAAELERSAARSRARGGLAAATAFLERAAQLTPDPARRAQRRLAAAQTTHHAGAPAAALRLLSMAEAGPLDELGRARAELLRGQIAFVNRTEEAAALLWGAATRLERLDRRLARDAYLEAISAAWLVGPVTSGVDLGELVQAARSAPITPPRPVDLLLDGLATRLTDGYAAGAPVLKRALLALRGPDRPREEAMRWLHLAGATAGHLWDERTWETLATGHVQLARELGACAMLMHALNMAIAMHACLGDLAAAASLAEEQAALTEATDSAVPAYAAPMLAAWRGREADAEQVFESIGDEVLRRHEGQGVIIIDWARAVLYNGLGRYEDALAAAQPASEHPPQIGGMPWAVRVELIEAATRAGEPERAATVFEQLIEPTNAAGTDWALGIQARCRALLSEGQAAQAAYQEAIQRLGRTRMRGELARAHLLYGEWLRREQHRVDARQQLRTAHEMFVDMGAEAFAQRAARELAAAGETTRKRKIETTGELTAQEAQVVALVREGLSNPEIGARLFISPRTVEWHLSNIFGKLNITSRRQLIRRSPFLGGAATSTGAGGGRVG
ncbi:MAG TPA: AAA family ATPase [Pseudonocardia sp.]|uniref:helix-turn-helix transcriptional regulator n=1 Tax=Pseudonocardia sp. TaxID=60912 RepID=UPI002C00BCB4|nr:AAA family ATPase [Pseudonocardia sp.]HTF49669.1 AAA family ATPase [Pseudonocardia sp.]